MKRKNRFLKLVWLPALLLAGWVLLAPFLAKMLIVEKTLARADAIIVLSGSATYLERTQKAAALFEAGVAPRVLLTDDGERAGWSRAEKRNLPFVELARQSLIERGVPAENIEVILPQGSGTIYEAQSVQKKLGETNWKSILIVTSAYHTRRTLWTFGRVLEAAGTSVEIGVESAPPGQQTPPPSIWWLSKFGWEAVAGEYVKSAYYWVYY